MLLIMMFIILFTESLEAIRLVLYLFMHVLYINIFLLTLTVIILKEFLFNKLLNTPASGSF